jgi:hypothetical protein
MVPALLPIGDALYVAGGCSAPNTCTNRVERLQNQSWEMLSGVTLRSEKGGLAYAVLAGVGYVMGGSGPDKTFSFMSECERFNGSAFTSITPGISGTPQILSAVAF